MVLRNQFLVDASLSSSGMFSTIIIIVSPAEQQVCHELESSQSPLDQYHNLMSFMQETASSRALLAVSSSSTSLLPPGTSFSYCFGSPATELGILIVLILLLLPAALLTPSVSSAEQQETASSRVFSPPSSPFFIPSSMLYLSSSSKFCDSRMCSFT